MGGIEPDKHTLEDTPTGAWPPWAHGPTPGPWSTLAQGSLDLGWLQRDTEFREFYVLHLGIFWTSPPFEKISGLAALSAWGGGGMKEGWL